jgi:hypothetical protein
MNAMANKISTSDMIKLGWRRTDTTLAVDGPPDYARNAAEGLRVDFPLAHPARLPDGTWTVATIAAGDVYILDAAGINAGKYPLV